MTIIDAIERHFIMAPELVEGLTQVFPQFNLHTAFIGLALCCIAGIALSPLVDALRVTQDRLARNGLVLIGGIIVGCSIWVMHFSAMFASNVPITDNFSVTALIMPLLVGSFFGCPVVLYLSKRSSNIVRVGGATLHSLIALIASHFLGMETLTGLDLMHYRPDDQMLVFLMAPLYMVAVWYLFLLFRQVKWLPRHMGGLFMGVGFTGLHFWSLNGTELFVHDVSQSNELAPYMVIGIISVSAILVLFSFTGVLIYTNFQRLGAKLLAEQGLFKQLREQSTDLHLLLDEAGAIISANPAAEAYFLPARCDTTGSANIYPGTESRLSGQFVATLFPELAYQNAPGRHFLDSSAGKRLLLSWSEPCCDQLEKAEIRMHALEALVTKVESQESVVYSLLAHDVTDRQEEERRMKFLSSAVDASIDSIQICDKDMYLIYINHAARELLADPLQEWKGKRPKDVFGAFDQDEQYKEMMASVKARQSWRGQLTRHLLDGGARIEGASISPVFDEHGELSNVVISVRDVTERIQLMRQLQESQKLESIGSLAAGVAHEINTPIQYVNDNLQFIGTSFSDISSLINRLQKTADAGGSLDAKEIGQALDDCDAEFLLEEFPQAVKQSVDGAQQVGKIVRAMKDFSHPSQDKMLSDINKSVASTVTVARNEWKYVASLELDLDEELPMVPCVIGQISQCILNIVVNAAHAISENNPDGKLGNIRVSTFVKDEMAVITIADDGPGIPDHVQQRIFDPFFTTKEVGKGTGQGLSIAWTSIVERHGGSLELESEPGAGAIFTIRLPLVDMDAENDVEQESKQERAGNSIKVA